MPLKEGKIRILGAEVRELIQFFAPVLSESKVYSDLILSKTNLQLPPDKLIIRFLTSIGSKRTRITDNSGFPSFRLVRHPSSPVYHSGHTGLPLFRKEH
jgi:hypothetical protein